MSCDRDFAPRHAKPVRCPVHDAGQLQIVGFPNLSHAGTAERAETHDRQAQAFHAGTRLAVAALHVLAFALEQPASRIGVVLGPVIERIFYRFPRRRWLQRAVLRWQAQLAARDALAALPCLAFGSRHACSRARPQPCLPTLTRFACRPSPANSSMNWTWTPAASWSNAGSTTFSRLKYSSRPSGVSMKP